MSKELKDNKNFIAYLRNKKGLTQTELANKFNITDKTVSKWENDIGFPDLLIQKDLADFLGVTIDELHMGKYDYKMRLKNKIKNIVLNTSVVLLIIIIPLLIFFSCYYIKYHDSLSIYYIDHIEANKGIAIYGTVVSTANYHIISISNIELDNITFDDKNDIVGVQIYANDKVINSVNFLNSITTKVKRNIDVHNIKVKINVIKNDKEYNYESDILELIDSKADDETDEHKYEINDNSNLETKLVKNGYQKNDNDIYVKTSKNLSVYISLNENKIIYHYFTKSTKSYYVYYYNRNRLEVYTYNIKNDVHTLVEKYEYYTDTKKLNCISGVCSTVDEVLEILDPYVSLVISD